MNKLPTQSLCCLGGPYTVQVVFTLPMQSSQLLPTILDYNETTAELSPPPPPSLPSLPPQPPSPVSPASVTIASLHPTSPLQPASPPPWPVWPSSLRVGPSQLSPPQCHALPMPQPISILPTCCQKVLCCASHKDSHDILNQHCTKCHCKENGYPSYYYKM